MIYAQQVYQFRLTIIIEGAVSEQYAAQMTQAEAWSEAQGISGGLAQMYADYRVRVEYVS